MLKKSQVQKSSFLPRQVEKYQSQMQNTAFLFVNIQIRIDFYALARKKKYF